MSAYASFFFNSLSSVAQFDTIQFSHPSFSQTYSIVLNNVSGVQLTLETGASLFFNYLPLSIVPTGTSDDLDQTLKIQFGDLGTLIPQEIDNVIRAGTALTKPSLIYRLYRSDQLTAPMDGPYRFEITQVVTTAKNGAALLAQAPRLNLSQTGEVYRLNRFPALRSFL